ncbi:MAG: hypothetical protein KAI24_02130 [Planctomycetes bacterium]|nr:hypothetical protein [Planctomycetota bacterium]
MIGNVGMYGAIGGAASALVLALVARSRGSKLFPLLTDPEDDGPIEVTVGDRARYYLANVAALLAGVSAVGLLYLVAPPHAEPRTFRATDGGGWLLGPFFLMLSVGALTSPLLLRWLVRPRPLAVLVYRASAKAGYKDFRPASMWLGAIVGCLALALHFALASLHLRLDQHGVRWRSAPFVGEHVRPWSEVADVRIVRTFEALTGKLVKQPHLVIAFADGAEVRHGRFDTRAPEVWEDAAAFAAERAGVPVRRVDK